MPSRTIIRPVPPLSHLGEHGIGENGIGTIAAERVTPRDNEEEAFVAVSMYARWMRPHPLSRSPWRTSVSDVSAHRIFSDLSAFIGHDDPPRYSILAVGDLNMFYGATGRSLSLPERERTVWARMEVLGLEFLGPQAPSGNWRRSRCASPHPSPGTYMSGWCIRCHQDLIGGLRVRPGIHMLKHTLLHVVMAPTTIATWPNILRIELGSAR